MLALLTTFLGPLLGLFGGVLTGFQKRADKKLDMEENERIRRQELELYRLNQSAKQEEFENQAYLTQIKTQSDNLKASYQHDTEYGRLPNKWVPFFRLIRPAFTFLLMIAVFIIFWFGDSNTITNGMSIQERIVASLLTMFEMAMTWWFADRQVSKKDK